jgi:nitric oxide reductase subunit B
VPPEKWSDRLVKVSFWSLNLGSAWMAVITLLPLGILQPYHSVDVGYWDARSLAFVTSDPNTMLEWLRLPGDVAFIGGGVLPLLWLSLQGVLGVVRGRRVEGCCSFPAGYSGWDGSAPRRGGAGCWPPTATRHLNHWTW